MKYTKRDLEEGNYFIDVRNNPSLRLFIKETFDIFMGSPIEKATFFDIGEHPGWMDDDGTYYRENGYIEVLPEQLTFLNTHYEIY